GVTTPSLQAARLEREEAIRHALGELPDPDGDGIGDHVIVLLRVLDECALKAIAQCQGRTPVDIARRYYTTARQLWDTLDRHPSPDWNPSQVQLRRGVAALPERQRKAVELAHLERDTYRLFGQPAGESRVIKCKYRLQEVAEVL